MRPNLEETADLVTSTTEIFNGKIHFSCIPYKMNKEMRIPRQIQNSIKNLRCSVL